MRIKQSIYILLFGTAFIVDLILGTFDRPVMLMIVCAIVAIYELVSPYIYTPS
ncbi:MAG: hypothetical protein RIQ41_326 [Candidatus Parcubacteria bacterium]|jgi:hypothetical protein